MKDLLKFLLILGTIMCVLSMVLGSCSTTKKAKPCNQCPQYSFIDYDTTTITIPHYNYGQVCYPSVKLQTINEYTIKLENL